MNGLKKRYNAILVIVARNANPNGDPLYDNRPRTDQYGYGIISQFCIKRKIRNRIMAMGEQVYVQPEDRALDEYQCLKDRVMAIPDFAEAVANKQKKVAVKVASDCFWDVRAFGSLFAFKNASETEDGVKSSGSSIGVQGPVSIQNAVSVLPVDISSYQITKCANAVDTKEKGSDTMGTSSVVDFGVYPVYISIDPEIAKRTGFTDEDAKLLKQALLTLFDGDASAARPAGSMWVEKLIWFEHETDYSEHKIQSSVKITPKENPRFDYHSMEDFEINIKELPGLNPEIYEDL